MTNNKMKNNKTLYWFITLVTIIAVFAFIIWQISTVESSAQEPIEIPQPINLQEK